MHGTSIQRAVFPIRPPERFRQNEQSNGNHRHFTRANKCHRFPLRLPPTVGREIGMEQAIALDAHVSEMMGAVQGQATKAQVGLDEIDLASAPAPADASIEEGLVISSEARTEGARRIVSKVGRCPIDEAAQAVGMDKETIEATCRAGVLQYMFAMVIQWNLNLSYSLKEFRSSADGYCIEKVALYWRRSPGSCVFSPRSRD